MYTFYFLPKYFRERAGQRAFYSDCRITGKNVDNKPFLITHSIHQINILRGNCFEMWNKQETQKLIKS